ncbi:MAG: hypothetical protein ACI8PZ_000815 [Myxococcota bacterium]|jgi:hypothetical protein
MRYLTPLLVLAACSTSSDVTFDANDMSSWEEVQASDQLAPPEPLVLEAVNLAPAGGSMTIEFSGGIPYEEILLGASTGGDAGGPCYAYFGGNCLDIAAPVRNAGHGWADDSGDYEFALNVPSGAAGVEVCLQAAIRRGPGGADSAVSNTICWTVQLDSDGDNIGDDDEIAMGLDPYDPDTDNDFYLDGDDCAPLDPAQNVSCGQLYAAQARSRGTGFYSIDEDGVSTLMWSNGEGYSGMAWDGDRLLGMRDGFGHTLDELDIETGDILNSYYTGGYYNGMTADADGNVFYSEGCSLYRIDAGADITSAYYVGSGPCNSSDMMTDADGNTWYVQSSSLYSVDTSGGGTAFVASTTGWDAGPRFSTNRVSAAACSQDDCFVINGANSGLTDLFTIDTATGEVTFISTIIEYVDALVVGP